MSFIYYDQTRSLAPLVETMSAHSCYAIDTEFAKVDTFRPILGLLQIKVNDHLALVDGHHPDLAQILALIPKAQELQFHACNEDIEIFYNASVPPLTNIFDTQIALSFLGHGLQLGYQAALREQLGIHIDKAETCSDWISRPLRPEQLQYAANDVAYLSDLVQVIKQKLADHHLLRFVQEDCQINALERAKPFKLEFAYQECASHEHSRYQLAQIQQLCVWRHHLAIETNVPKTFILKNRMIQNLVQKPPQNLYHLQQHREISPSIIREHGKTIVQLLKNVPDDHALWPNRIPKPFRFSSLQQQTAFEGLLKQISQILQIPVEVLFRKRWLNSLARNIHNGFSVEQLPAHLRGWRYQPVVLPLVELLHS